MKTLWDFHKRRYGTAPTITGQHASRIRTAIPKIAGLFPQQDEQIEHDVDLAPAANDHLRHKKIIFSKLDKLLYSRGQMLKL